MKFRIFEQKFTWTRTKINFLISSLTIFSFFIFRVLIKNDFQMVVIPLISIIIISNSYFRLAKLLGKNKIEKLQGFFTGDIEFKNDEIIIQNLNQTQILKLDEIETIKITAKDILGKGRNFGIIQLDYENGLSAGLNNFITITLLNKRTLHFQVELINENIFIENRKLIENYYYSEKLNYLTTIDLLNLTTKDEWENLKAKKSVL